MLTLAQVLATETCIWAILQANLVNTFEINKYWNNYKESMSNKLSVAEEFLVHYSATGLGGTTNKMVEPI